MHTAIKSSLKGMDIKRKFISCRDGVMSVIYNLKDGPLVLVGKLPVRL